MNDKTRAFLIDLRDLLIKHEVHLDVTTETHGYYDNRPLIEIDFPDSRGNFLFEDEGWICPKYIDLLLKEK